MLQLDENPILLLRSLNRQALPRGVAVGALVARWVVAVPSIDISAVGREGLVAVILISEAAVCEAPGALPRRDPRVIRLQAFIRLGAVGAVVCAGNAVRRVARAVRVVPAVAQACPPRALACD